VQRLAQRSWWRSILFGPAAAAALALLLALPAGARADTEKCRSAIAKATAAFVQSRTRALQKCHDKVVKGKFPPTTVCEGDARTGFAIAKAADKLERTIVRACGGPDATCGTADDEPLAEIGWGGATCPNLQGASCSNAIASCADIPVCLECIADAAVDEAIALFYDELIPSDRRTQKELNQCQVAIGKATSGYLESRSRILAKCWDAVIGGDGTAPCPAPGDGKAEQALLRAEAKKVVALCKACGGADALCGGETDLTPAEIGFPTSCPAVAGCAGTVADLGDLVDCVDCVTDREVDCAALAAVPGLAAYPAACATPAPAGELNFSLPPVFGSTALTSGFVPDPFSVGLTAGGPVSVSYLGGGCSGFTTSAPSFSVNYTSGAFPTLRFYFIGSGDTTLIINSPSGSFFCVDDSFGTLNPTLDFNSPASGRYDVWVATFAQGASIGGTLFVTENTANHP
jgi:hypothetical protein